ALTTCAAGLPRSTATARVVVAEKSRVSTPPPASLIVSLPRALSVSKRKVSLPAPPFSVSSPPPPSITLLRPLPVRVSPAAPPLRCPVVARSPGLCAARGWPPGAAGGRGGPPAGGGGGGERSGVRPPPPASWMVSLPGAGWVSRGWVSLRPLPVGRSSPAP